MAKRNSIMSYLYLVGMALVVVGFCCPMFKALGGGANGFKFINFNKGGFASIGALLIFLGAVAGVLLCFVSVKAPVSLKLVALVVSIVGGIVLIIGFNDNVVYKAIAKGLLKHATVGFYFVLIGWVAAIAGYVSNRD